MSSHLRLLLEPALDRLDELLLLWLLLLGQLQQACQRHKVGEQRLTRLGSHPQHSVVVVPVPVGVLHRGLGLADATQTADGLGLRQGGGLACTQGCGEARGAPLRDR